ncbi:MAG: AAA family ATPase [Candidatus Thermoplasmatota archaeon]|nr:AAA family ATPase [Candidatus Thermoplasmatota archaeon]
MKLENISIRNVRSFHEEADITFDEGFNVFIGPNKGGKSNLLDIIVIVLKRYVLYNWIVNDVNVGNPSHLEHQIISQNMYDPPYRYLDRFFGDGVNPQKVKLRIKVTEDDLRGLEVVRDNMTKLREIETSRFYNSSSTTAINMNGDLPGVGSVVEIDVTNWANAEPSQPSSRNFLNYTRNYELFSILIEEYNSGAKENEKINSLPPPFQYFSPNRDSTFGSENVNLAGIKKNDVLKEFTKNTSRTLEKTWDFISYYLAMKMRSAGDDTVKFHEDVEIKLIEETMKGLGYEGITVTCIDKQTNKYMITAREEGRESPPLSMSSGEKEMLNFLLSIYAFGLRNGLLIIDEPELHIHPTWQKRMAVLLERLQEDRKLQIILVTHSASFITKNTTKNTFRVFRDGGESKLGKFDQNRKNIDELDMYRVINTLGFQTALFSDAVILVEGQTDRIIFRGIVDKLLSETEKNIIKSIEIFDVGGKKNLNKFREILGSFSINAYIIADLDYIIDTTEMAGCTDFDSKKAMENMHQRNSKDAASLFQTLDRFIENDCLQVNEVGCKQLKELSEYIKSRYTTLKQECEDRKTKLLSFLSEKGIYVLSKGEIEQYFLTEHLGLKYQLEEAIKTADRVMNSDISIDEELVGIVRNIIDKS